MKETRDRKTSLSVAIKDAVLDSSLEARLWCDMLMKQKHKQNK